MSEEVSVQYEWSSAARSLWAKTGEEPEDWLSLPRHLEDAAAVARLLWERWLAPGVRDRLDAELDLRGEGANLLAWLAGVHDVGKAAPSFQSQLMARGDRTSFADRVIDAGLPLRGPALARDRYPHSAGSACAVKRWLPSAVPGASKKVTERLASVVGAHHGLPSRIGMEKRAALDSGGPWRAVQDELLVGITYLTGAEGVIRRLPVETELRHHLMLLSGLVVMGDWIASNQDLFPLNVPHDASSERRAGRAWMDLDLGEPWATQPLPEDAGSAYAVRFAWPGGRTPWPVQADALRVARGFTGPGLLCIEAPMGVGKTEAALAAAEELARTTGRTGVFVAAPTMATSDALYTRVAAWAERAGMPGRPASLFLAHSKATLNEDARSLPRRGLGVRSVAVDAPGDHESVVAHQWLTGRKKGLLSSIAVGTVDQVLLMALQAKHSMLRHLALASKVVVIDECHAYDTYMGRYLQRALHWLGAYGVPVVLLSATLPPGIRGELVRAYRAGLTATPAQSTEVPDTADAYPVLTAATAEGVTATTSERSGRELRLDVQPMSDEDDDLAAAMSRVQHEGGCLLVVCNTVARAQHAYRLARVLVGSDARLVHARFIASDRVTKERELLHDLGPRAARGAGRPPRRIVVATQVVEQSLDLDFDAMVTDVAPVDLVLQRAGRVHRHTRPVGDRPAWARVPRVHVRGAQSWGSDDGAPEFEPSQVLVYARATLLASTAALGLHTGGASVSIPSDIPRLVREVYSAAPPIPAPWADTWERAAAELDARTADQRSRAATFLLDTPRSAERFGALWAIDSRDVDSAGGEARGLAQVRDSSPTIEVLLTRSANGGYTLLDGGADAPVVSTGQVPPWPTAQHIAASSVRLPHRFSQPWLFDAALDQLEAETDLAWQQSPSLRGQLQLMVDAEGRATVAGHRLRYDAELGLLEEKE